MPPFGYLFLRFSSVSGPTASTLASWTTTGGLVVVVGLVVGGLVVVGLVVVVRFVVLGAGRLVVVLLVGGL